jgi:hypothetical protein
VSDLSAFHGVRDANELDGPVFFMLAERLVTYDGAVRAAHIIQQMEEKPSAPQGPSYDPSVPTGHSEAPPADAPALTKEQLTAMFGPAPSIGQDVGMFEIGNVT